MRVSAALAMLMPVLALAQSSTSDESRRSSDVPTSNPNAAEAMLPPPSPPTRQDEVGKSPEEKLAETEGKLTSLEEQYIETRNAVLSMAKLRFSGYVQARYTHDQRSTASADARGTPGILDGFGVRRGRFKLTYNPAKFTTLVLQIDMVPSGVALRDAEVFLTEPWTRQNLTLVVGQTKWPFGYEVLQSSSDREFPERTRMIRAFFPGERDRGAKLAGKFGPVRATLGVFDGNGTGYRTPAGATIAFDNDRYKDVVGRVAFDLKWITGGVSGHLGRTVDPGNPTRTPAVESTGIHDRTRLGADLQLYLDLVALGGTALKGEVVVGHTWSNRGVEVFAPGMGWYALLVQNLGLNWQAAVRYDYFDGHLGVPDVGADPRNSVGTFGAALNYFWGESVRISAVYEVPMTSVEGGATDPADNLFTLQFQAKY